MEKVSTKNNPLKLTEYFVKHKEVPLRDKMARYSPAPESKRAWEEDLVKTLMNDYTTC